MEVSQAHMGTVISGSCPKCRRESGAWVPPGMVVILEVHASSFHSGLFEVHAQLRPSGSLGKPRRCLRKNKLLAKGLGGSPEGWGHLQLKAMLGAGWGTLRSLDELVVRGLGLWWLS